MKDTSKNKEAEKIAGLRLANGTSIDFPCEYGYKCPVCDYEVLKDGNYDERLTWSEYECFLWCEVCDKDYPTPLCVTDIDEAIKTYLKCVQIHKNKK